MAIFNKLLTFFIWKMGFGRIIFTSVFIGYGLKTGQRFPPQPFFYALGEVLCLLLSFAAIGGTAKKGHREIIE
jgi:hypothetical protein